MVSWQQRDEDTIIFNVDESALNNVGKAGYGGLIRKHDGSFLCGFFVAWGSRIFYILRLEKSYLSFLTNCWCCFMLIHKINCLKPCHQTRLKRCHFI